MTFNLPRVFRPFCLATAERFLAKTFNLLFDDGSCQLLTCCSDMLDCLRFSSTSSAQLIGVWLLQNIFLVVSC